MSFDMRIDIDPVVTCPYNKSHKIARSRLQKHLIKCEKNFPADYKQQCPYDATHRVFEHEMIEHVTHCDMKFNIPLFKDNYDNKRLPESESEMKMKIQSDENWDENSNDEDKNNPFNEPIFETVNMKQYSNFESFRGNSGISSIRRNNMNLRRPFGYSESMMLEINNESIDDDTQSVTSDMGFGRGQNLRGSIRGNYVRGASRICKRSLRDG